MKNNKEINKKENDIKKSKKKHGFLFYFFNAIFFTLVGVTTISTVLNIVDRKTGYSLPFHNAVIISDSMSYVNDANLSYLDKDVPHIKRNDMIFSNRYSSYDNIQLLDVITYLGKDGVLVCHRVVDKYEDEGTKWIVCRGDANDTNDTPISYERVKGKVYNVIPGIGMFLSFLQSGYFLAALLLSAFFILLGYYISNYKKPKEIVSKGVKDEK